MRVRLRHAIRQSIGDTCVRTLAIREIVVSAVILGGEGGGRSDSGLMRCNRTDQFLCRVAEKLQ